MAEGKISFGKQADKNKVDQAKIGKGKKPELKGDVEAQHRSWKIASCPHCWSVNEVIVDSNRWVGYYCWNCAGYFEV